MSKRKTFHRVVLVLAALALLAAVSPAQSKTEKPFLGSWKGQIDIMGQTLEIRLVFTLDEAKKIAGTIDSISQGATGIKLADIQIEDKAIGFALDPSLIPGNALMKGTLDAEGKKITGDFSQSGVSGTFTVEREAAQK